MRVLAAILAVLLAHPAAAQERILEVSYVPAPRAQIAIWIEGPDGHHLRTLRLTQAVSLFGIGNRPGASQMNSGFTWPYGRREGVLPVWAHARAAAPGAELFPRVIFQDRISEGHASRSSNDFSPDPHFCLSFMADSTRRDGLDAIGCASPNAFNSDKGRYLTAADIESGYSEPIDLGDGMGSIPRPLELGSLYPPRRDIVRCTASSCYDHPDVSRFRDDAERVMPELDAITMATPPGGVLQRHRFEIPTEWPEGEYTLWIEVHVEGDYNASWELPTPQNPSAGSAYAGLELWDFWALSYGYPYRGQPSVVYRVPFVVGDGARTSEVLEPAGYGSIHGWGEAEGQMRTMDGSISDDPINAPGSGADRLRVRDGWRVRVRTEICIGNEPPGLVSALAVAPHSSRRDAHRWARLSFRAAEDDQSIGAYEVRISSAPIDPAIEASFMRGVPACAPTRNDECIALTIEPSIAAGETIEVELGALDPMTHYWIGVRAIDGCARPGPIAVVEHTTPAIEFTTVSPCFVATAVYGTPMADEIVALRRFRDRHLRSNAIGRAGVRLYEHVGPRLAAAIREQPERRQLARALLSPLIALARASE